MHGFRVIQESTPHDAENKHHAGVHTVAIILILAGITYTYTQSISRHTVESHQQALTKEAAKMVQMWLDHRFKLIDALAHTLEDLYLAQGQDPSPF